jgi:thiamine-phosphate pyrophosphorylase
MRSDPDKIRESLMEARVMLLFTPELCGDRDPLEVLEAALPWVDMVQIRPKPVGDPKSSNAPCPARETHDWCVRVLDLVGVYPAPRALVLVDDRVDVAALLWERGCAGVHIGQDDAPVAAARALLGPDPLIGLSTHDLDQIAEAERLAVDYLGFGPVHATSTKGYAQGLGASACASARAASTRPLFAIGGIDRENVGELAPVGRIAVSSAILCAEDPARAARELRSALSPGGRSILK